MTMWDSLKRLKWVRDSSLLPTHPLVPHEATSWYVATFIDPEDVVITDRSISIRVVSNPVVTWYRTFTQDGFPPPKLTSQSFLQLDEWLPWHEPTREAAKGFARISGPRFKSIAWLTGDDHVAQWSEQSKRHLKAFKKTPGITLRTGTLAELVPAYSRSQVPPDMQEVFIGETQRHLAAHPELVDILIAEHAEHGIIGGFVGVNCDEAKQSLYLLGFFTPEASRFHPMLGLVDWWFRRSKERGYLACNFGVSVGPRSWPIDPGNGYSLFKTHFGVTRIWQPGNHWRISFGSKKE